MKKIISFILFIAIIFGLGFFLRQEAARALVNMGMPDIALALDARSAFFAGLHYFNMGNSATYDLERARVYFLKAIENDSEHTLAYYQLSRVELVRGEIEAGLGHINKAIAQDPAFLKAYYIRALLNGFAKHANQAERDFEFILEKDKESEGLWAVYNDLAWIKFQQGDFAGVEETSKKGLALYPDNPWLLNSLGNAYLNTHRKIQAKEVFTQALEKVQKLTPNDWRMAYSANDPMAAQEGLTRMLNMIQFNMKLTSE